MEKNCTMQSRNDLCLLVFDRNRATGPTVLPVSKRRLSKWLLFVIQQIPENDEANQAVPIWHLLKEVPSEERH
jgi:hypothetical protein